MTTLRTAAQQALEALEEATTYTSGPIWSPSMTEECAAAAYALRAALAEDALQKFTDVSQEIETALAEQRLTDMEQKMERSIESLKAALAEPTTEESSAVEPVAWKLWDEDPQGGGDWRYYDAKDFKNGINPIEYFDGLVPLYTAPPQRKPLTEEEIAAAYASCKHGSVAELARAIERAHGITP